MSITYSLDVSSASFCGLHRLLFRWKGSIWKAILPELCVWLLFYFLISFCYRYGMTREQQTVFEQLSVFFYTYSDYIPITFLLGFFVSAVFNRWIDYVNNLGWIDSPALLIATYVRGTDEAHRRIRRNLLRYLVLTQAMVFRDISSCVKRRFPTMNHLVTAGLMTEAELKEFDSVRSPHIKYWVPIQWAFVLLRKARESDMISSDIIYTDLLEKIRQYRVNILTLTIYDWIPVPLVYTQVVNIAVRAFFVVALFGRQYLIHENTTPNSKSIDLYVPIMTILQFLFYIGWVKVAEVLLNPLGDDDDASCNKYQSTQQSTYFNHKDLETNWILDRNLQVGYSIVDDGYGRCPKDGMEKDIFYDDLIPQPLYTAESAQRTNNPMIGSCNDLMTVAEDALLLKPRPRLMSTSTVINPTHKLSGEMDENGRIIVPVRNHNPVMRRCNSVDHYSDSNSSDHRNTRLLESLRRRFSKKRSRRGSTPSIMSDLYYSHAPMGRSQLRNGISNGNGIANPGNMSRQSSICSSILYDGVQSPFQHSMVSNFTQSTRVATSGENVQLDPAALNQSNDLRTEEETTNSDKLGQSWSVNEMLPIIEEDEREKGRHQSYYSTESGSNSSLSDSGIKKEDSPDIKSILNKSLSTINEESRSLSLGKEKSDVDLPQFAKTVSFGPTIFRQRTTDSNASTTSLESPTPSTMFHIITEPSVDDEQPVENEQHAEDNSTKSKSDEVEK